MSESNTITVTNGGLLILKQLAASPGLLKDAVSLFAVGGFVEDHLTDHTAPTEAAAAEAWMKADHAPIPVKGSQRRSLKAMIEAALQNGAMSAHPLHLKLMRSLGIEPKDDEDAA